MAYFTYLSEHALDRIKTRTQLTAHRVTEILESQAVVNIGAEPGTRRVHLLFYSPVDDDYFVAVRDNLYGTVSTVLTLEYHQRWQVTEANKARAKELSQTVTIKAIPSVKAHKVPPTSIHVAAVLHNGVKKKLGKETVVEAITARSAADRIAVGELFDVHLGCKNLRLDLSDVAGFTVKTSAKGSEVWLNLRDISVIN